MSYLSFAQAKRNKRMPANTKDVPPILVNELAFSQKKDS